jgi:sulfite exporter TauE/SafE
MAALIAVLLASLFGSLHCAGMCGPLVALAVGGPDARTTRSRLLLHVAYHGGRLVTYTFLGAVCGLLGAALDRGGNLVGLQRAAAYLAGVTMVLIGVAAVLRYTGVRLPHLPLQRNLQRVLVIGQRAALGWRPLPRALTIGLLTALLPCGWLYAFAIIAAGTGGALLGAGVMVAFWIGTVPVLVSLGVGIQTLTGTLGRRLPLATAILILLFGLYSISDRLLTPAGAFEPLIQSLGEGDTQERVRAVQHVKPPCCQQHRP